MVVRDRQQMAQLLNERMNRTYTDLSDRKGLEPDTSLVKTYLIEAHISESSRMSEALRLAEKLFSEKTFGEKIPIRLHYGQDSSLVSVETKVKKENLVIYVDFTNPRFWIMHSVGSSINTDWFIEKLIRVGPELDRAWISADFLEYISKLGSFRGLNLDYDRREVPDVDFQSPQAPVEFLKMQLWGNKASEILQILRNNRAFPHETTLSKVKIKFWLNNNNDGDFTLDDIKYDGKVTARGTSFQSHIALVSHVLSKYASQIKKIEEKYSLRISINDARLYLEGEPINFLFDRPIENIDKFCESLFSCGYPFRLWGVPMQLSKDFWRIQAVDLHVGNPLQFEIAPEFIRVYLAAGSCGNSILRFYTNIQHYYDSLVRVEDGNGRNVIEF